MVTVVLGRVSNGSCRDGEGDCDGDNNKEEEEVEEEKEEGRRWDLCHSFRIRTEGTCHIGTIYHIVAYRTWFLCRFE